MQSVEKLKEALGSGTENTKAESGMELLRPFSKEHSLLILTMTTVNILLILGRDPKTL
jgi:hypothetical protein